MGTAVEKIDERKEKIARLKARIAADQEKVSKLETEIEELESLEVKGIMKEYSLTVEDFRILVATQQSKKAGLNPVPLED